MPNRSRSRLGLDSRSVLSLKCTEMNQNGGSSDWNRGHSYQDYYKVGSVLVRIASVLVIRGTLKIPSKTSWITIHKWMELCYQEYITVYCLKQGSHIHDCKARRRPSDAIELNWTVQSRLLVCGGLQLVRDDRELFLLRFKFRIPVQ